MADDSLIGFASFDELLQVLQIRATPKKCGRKRLRFYDSPARTAEEAVVAHQREIWNKANRKRQRKKDRERMADIRWRRKVFKKTDGRALRWQRARAAKETPR